MSNASQERPDAPFLGPLRPVSPHNTFVDEGTAEAENVDHDAQVDDAEEEEEEEALTAKPLRSPTAPTAAERAAHEPTHLPYRSWCDVCVAPTAAWNTTTTQCTK